MIATTVAAALAILTPPTQDVLNSAPAAYSSSQNGVISGQDMALFQQGLAAARARDVIGTQSIMSRISDPSARKLVEWMTGEEAQKLFADINQEFPANPKVKPSEEVAAWGSFKADSIPVEIAGKRQAEAIRLMDRAGWN